MNFSDVRLAIDWLISGCPSASTPQQVLAELCNRLACCGIPLSCAEVFVRTLHPNVMGRRFTWRVGSDVEISEISFDSLKRPEFKNSPVAQVCESGVAFRLRLGDADPFSSLLIHAFRNEQLTDFSRRRWSFRMERLTSQRGPRNRLAVLLTTKLLAL